MVDPPRVGTPTAVPGYAVRHFGLAGNPSDALLRHEKPKVGEDGKRFLNRNEIAALLAAAVDAYRLPIGGRLLGACASASCSF